MKTIKFEEIQKYDNLFLIIYHDGDNPIFVKKEDFDIDSDILSTNVSILDITVDEIYSLEKTGVCVLTMSVRITMMRGYVIVERVRKLWICV